MAEMSRVTPSGVTIPEGEYKEIEKSVRKDTLKTVLAVVGVGALFVIVRGWIEGTKPEDTTSTD